MRLSPVGRIFLAALLVCLLWFIYQVNRAASSDQDVKQPISPQTEGVILDIPRLLKTAYYAEGGRVPLPEISESESADQSQRALNHKQNSSAPERKAFFFAETSSTRTKLDARVACAVESAAKHHPDHSVYLLLTSSVRRQSRPGRLLHKYCKY